MENLFLAGDWTQTGWPATMEGAARPQRLSCRRGSASRGSGRGQEFLRPDLPVCRDFSAQFWAKRNAGGYGIGPAMKRELDKFWIALNTAQFRV